MKFKSIERNLAIKQAVFIGLGGKIIKKYISFNSLCLFIIIQNKIHEKHNNKGGI